MSEHSPEPWTVTSTKYGWFAVHAADGMPVGLLQVSNKDIERIVACVNACAGTIDASGPLVQPTVEPDMAELPAILRYIAESREEIRKQILSACCDKPSEHPEPECCEKCRFWQEIPRSVDGECHAKAPFPMIHPTDWCGEFKAIVKP